MVATNERKNEIPDSVLGNEMKRILVLVFLSVLLYSCASTDGTLRQEEPIVKDNSIMVLVPYRHGGTWVFDDPGVGLVREPFVAGVPEIIDYLVKDIPGAGKGFRLLFSEKPFPGYQMRVVWRRYEDGGNWYYCEELNSEGWLCPALFKYFKTAPEEIYVKAEERSR